MVGRKGGDRFSAPLLLLAEPLLASVLYTILKKNAFNHRLFMEKIPIKLLLSKAASTFWRQAGGSISPIL